MFVVRIVNFGGFYFRVYGGNIFVIEGRNIVSGM